ncbi:MAG TPA: 6-phosphogluconolactonase [Acidimicrobiales bacterium]|nr:6-phosphogluconolactonase [Acidimicrobiales bacterium]
MNGRVEVVGSVADAFADLVTERLTGPRDGGFSFFLSGGSLAGQAYRRLAETSVPVVDWTSVDAYWGDERCVSIDDQDSNYHLCHQTLLDRVGPLGSDHPMYRSGPPEDAAADYQRLLEELPSFDLVHLGMGPDGHCASLFPESDALDVTDPDILVVANRDPLAHNPHDRITLTFPAIARARLVVFTVAGGSKHDAFARVVAGDDLPAARVSAEEVVWLVDADAAGGALVP